MPDINRLNFDETRAITVRFSSDWLRPVFLLEGMVGGGWAFSLPLLGSTYTTGEALIFRSALSTVFSIVSLSLRAILGVDVGLRSASTTGLE